MALLPTEFDVEAGGRRWPATYRRFIEELRRGLGVRPSHNLPVLPPQENPPSKWFDIVLRSSSHAITLRIRRDNLYSDGYQMENPYQWLEFGYPSSPQHLIPGSTFLGFDGGYDDLQRVGEEMIENIELGQEQLKNAVNQLATSTRSKDRARSLIVVIQMICESIKFESISEHLATEFPKSSTPPNWMLALEHGWGDLSAALLRADDDPQHRFRLPQPNAMEIVTADQAAAALGILLDPSGLHQSGVPGKGRPLAEVFGVRINNIDGEDPGHLYRTITAKDGLGFQYIYNRTRDNYQSIHPGQHALLTGPARAISSYGSFTINVDLWDQLAGFEVSHGQIWWNVYNPTNKYDVPLFQEVYGMHGSVTVNYAVLSDAAEATVEITLQEGVNPAHVYGWVTARNGIGETVLFCRKRDEAIGEGPGHLLPLSRSVVAVPLTYCLCTRQRDTSLVVWVHLYYHDSNACPDDREIAKGTAEFPAQLAGTNEEDIGGEFGMIHVKVTWNQDI